MSLTIRLLGKGVNCYPIHSIATKAHSVCHVHIIRYKALDERAKALPPFVVSPSIKLRRGLSSHIF